MGRPNRLHAWTALGLALTGYGIWSDPTISLLGLYVLVTVALEWRDRRPAV